MISESNASSSYKIQTSQLLRSIWVDLKEALSSLDSSRSHYCTQMKTSSPLVSAVLVLLLTAATVQGIRLDGETHAALSHQVLFNKSGVEAAVASSGEMDTEESISEEDDRAGHRRPENDIHVDYYGPRGHIPSHN